MQLYIYFFYLSLGITKILTQEITIPVGEKGNDTLTTIRFVDAAGNYDMGYNENQLTGGASFHREKGYINGTRTGSYGYTTINGLIRIVTYVADQDGYRAEVLTNEPGTDPVNPSSVTLTKETEPDREALSRWPTGSQVTQEGAQSSVVYSGESDPVRNYVVAPVVNAGGQVRVQSPYGMYQYVV